MKGNLVAVRSTIPQSKEEILAWHRRPGALEAMVPSRHHFKDLTLLDHKLSFSFRVGFIWKSAELAFSVESQGPTTSIIEDQINVPIPFPHRHIEHWCSWRQAVIANELSLLKRCPSPRLRILVSGASGMIGRPLTAFLRLAGHTVIRLVRSAKEAQKDDTIYWNPSAGEVKNEDFEGFDAIIHLAGENVGDHRWTKKRKDALFVSRCRDTWLLSQILSRIAQPPKTFICASAVGYYGDRPEERLTEQSSNGKGFLANLCQKWEDATKAASDRGIRVINTRFGPVLSPEGGMLEKLKPSFHWGLGSILGTASNM